MVETTLNDWLESTIRKAERTIEDADRRSFAGQLFKTLIRDVHEALMHNAIRAERPKIERVQSEESVVLRMEWFDQESGWHLNFDVARVLGEKPRVQMSMSGNPENYDCGAPTKEEMIKGLSDYFESWKRGGSRARTAG